MPWRRFELRSAKSVNIFYLLVVQAKPTSSSGSLIAKAAESAGVMSISSTSFEISPNARFQSSAKGPVVVSFGRVPTFFCDLAIG